MPACLVALDLDGTLLSDSTVIPAGHERAVAELRSLGAEIAIVTGRSMLTSEWIWRRLRLSAPIVCFNGAWLGEPGRDPMAVARLAESDVRCVIDALRGWDGSVNAYPDARTWLMDREIPRTRGWGERYRAPIEVAPQPFADWRGPSCKLMFVAEPELLARAARHLRARLGARFHIVVSEEDRVEILPRGITKAWGLERLARSIGVERAQVWAVGDADNDLEMIRWAGHGCVMGHAHDTLRRHARHVLPSIHARGLCALPGLVERALGGR
jgi:5-amino-6-(5-phospho-D-ribitylamino)uracil phosphatase